jgi:CheY-like chemotaxis protein
LLTARNGHEALEKARQEAPDLILMDVVMPRMTGLEACKALRQDEKTRELPIILVTTKGQEHDVDAGFKSGCSDYLTKPINGLELLTMLKSYLGE